jgi:hypothetical protein
MAMTITSFHDGDLTSVEVGEGTAALGLRHVDGRRFSLTLAGVEALAVNDFREGNIVLELHEVTGPEFEETNVVHDPRNGHSRGDE